MEADASLALAVGSALYLLGCVLVVVLCRMALRARVELDAEITARSLRLRVRPSHPNHDDRLRAIDGGKHMIDPVRLATQSDQGRCYVEQDLEDFV